MVFFLTFFFEEGEEVPVLTNVCVIGEPGEDVLKFNPKTFLEAQKDDISHLQTSEQDVPMETQAKFQGTILQLKGK